MTGGGGLRWLGTPQLVVSRAAGSAGVRLHRGQSESSGSPVRLPRKSKAVFSLRREILVGLRKNRSGERKPECGTVVPSNESFRQDCQFLISLQAGFRVQSP